MYCPVFNAGLHIREYVDVRGACSPVQTQTNGCIGELAVTECPKDTRCKRGNVSRPRVENFINFPVAIRPGDTPVPIPNTMVKTWAADGTILETVWESRWTPA